MELGPSPDPDFRLRAGRTPLRRAKGAAQTVTRMRDFKGMKRQRGRNRGGGGGSGGGGGGGKPQQNANRAFESNGPDNVKVRGNAQHVFEKYQQLARDATGAGDRVLAENYLQHAEHYFRLVRAINPQRPASEILGRDTFASGYDIDFEDESGQANEAYSGGDSNETSDSQDTESRDRGGWRDRDDRPRDDRQRDDRQQRDDRPRGDDRQQQQRDDRPRDDRPRDDRPRDDRARDDRPRDERPRDDRPRGEGRRDRWRDRDDRPRERAAERPERDPLAVVEPQAAPLVASEERPSPVLRDAEGGESHAPAFLQARVPTAPTEAAAEGEPKPRARRRRAPRSFEGGETPSGETEEA